MLEFRTVILKQLGGIKLISNYKKHIPNYQRLVLMNWKISYSQLDCVMEVNLVMKPTVRISA